MWVRTLFLGLLVAPLALAGTQCQFTVQETEDAGCSVFTKASGSVQPLSRATDVCLSASQVPPQRVMNVGMLLTACPNPNSTNANVDSIALRLRDDNQVIDQVKAKYGNWFTKASDGSWEWTDCSKADSFCWSDFKSWMIKDEDNVNLGQVSSGGGPPSQDFVCQLFHDTYYELSLAEQRLAHEGICKSLDNATVTGACAPIGEEIQKLLDSTSSLSCSDFTSASAIPSQAEIESFVKATPTTSGVNWNGVQAPLIVFVGLLQVMFLAK